MSIRDATKLGNKQDLRKFLYFTIFHYHLHEKEMWNAYFYLRLWKNIMEATDNPQNFYLVTKGMPSLEWTGERYIPVGPDVDTHYEHLHRYAFASGFVKGKKVLDLGSGEGYGSFLLSQTAESVIGIEIDETSVNHASRKYIRSNLQFKVADATNVPLSSEKLFDVIVCFELLEHIEDHEELLREVKRLLKDKGLFIISTPNKLLYSDERNFHNPFHLKELYFAEFADLLRKSFKNVSFLGQRVFPVSNIWSLGGHYKNWEEFYIKQVKDEFQYVNSHEKAPLYFIALASDHPMRVVTDSSYLVDTSESLFRKNAVLENVRSELETIYNSHGWKALTCYYKFRDKIFSPKTKRRAYVKSLLKMVIRMIRTLRGG